MRQALINQNSDLVDKNNNYIMRIVSGDDLGIEQSEILWIQKR